MENNPYAAPQSSLAPQLQDVAPFYVVSSLKYWVMLFGTMGLYEIYWFYRNWFQYKAHAGRDIWPIARAIFSVFFAHSLNRLIDQQIKQKGFVFDWSPNLYALIYVAIYLTQYGITILSFMEIEVSTMDLLGIVLLPVLGLTLWRVQQAVNLVCDDPAGESNSVFTAANYAWLAFGCLLWILTISAMFVADTE